MEQSATPWRVFDAPSTGTEAPGSDNQAGSKRAAAASGGVSNGLASPNTMIALAGVTGAIVIGLIAIVVAISGSGGQIVDAPTASAGLRDDTAMLAGARDLVVDVSGAVTKPGVYHLPAGSRVGDAIDAAGGFSPRVDAGRAAATLNLAETLKDGARVHVPSRDDAATTAGTAADGSGAAGGGAVNLNTASQSELESLPGIGAVTAKKIIDSRTTAPFTSIDELRERKLVGSKAFEQLRTLVSVD